MFPLSAVLFPGGVLPLRIFEPRYLDMVSECLRTDSGIGVVLIRDGREVGEVADTYEVGTLCHIRYWHKRPDGLLGVTLQGEQCFRVISKEVRANQLIIAEAELIPESPVIPVTESHQQLVDLLKQKNASVEVLDRSRNMGQKEDFYAKLNNWADVLILTSTSILNNTTEEILQNVGQKVKTIMLGPSTPMVAEAFHHLPVHMLAGTVPIDKEKVLKAIRHGMGTPVLQKFSRKAFLSL